MFTGMPGLLSWSKSFCRLEPHFFYFVPFCTTEQDCIWEINSSEAMNKLHWREKRISTIFFTSVSGFWLDTRCIFTVKKHRMSNRIASCQWKTTFTSLLQSKSQYLYNKFIFDKISLFAFNHPEFCSETCIHIQCQRRIRLFNGNHIHLTWTKGIRQKYYSTSLQRINST